MSNFAYFDANRTQHMVSEASVNFAGTWSSSGTYSAANLDAVVYGNGTYVAIIDNVGGNPTTPARRNRPAKWSPLVQFTR